MLKNGVLQSAATYDACRVLWWKTRLHGSQRFVASPILRKMPRPNLAAALAATIQTWGFIRCNTMTLDPVLLRHLHWMVVMSWLLGDNVFSRSASCVNVEMQQQAMGRTKV